MRRVWVLLAAAAALLAACGSSSHASNGTDAASTSSSLPTYSQAGTTISTTVGQQFVIELDANLTTGYSWQLAQQPGQQVQLVDDDYVSPGSLPGAGGMQRFQFQAASSGSTTLAFAYARPWETGVAPAKTASFPVTVG